MKYTKDEEARAERSSVKMWPGITAGIIIGLIAFVLSFDALRLVFVACGINPYLSWGGPVCVDGTILLCTWATWGFKKGHIRGSAYPWVGLVLFSSFSIAGNALHAMLNTGFHLPAWVPPVIMSIPPVALLYATHLIVIIAGDRLDKINTVLPVGLTVMEDTDVPAPVPAPSAMPAPAIPSEPPASAPEPAEPAKPEIPDLFDFQTIEGDGVEVVGTPFQGACYLWDPDKRQATAVLTANVEEWVLSSDRQKAGRAMALNTMLKELSETDGFIELKETSFVLPGHTPPEPEYLKDDRTPQWAREDLANLWHLPDILTPLQNSNYVSVSVNADRLPHVVRKDRTERAAVGIAMGDLIRMTVAPSLLDCGARRNTIHWCSVDDLRYLIRTIADPEHANDRPPVNRDDPTVTWVEEAKEHDYITLDSAVARTYWIYQWPDFDVQAGWIRDLVTDRRMMAFCHIWRPLTMEQSEAELRNRKSSMRQRAKLQDQREKSRDERREEKEQRLRELEQEANWPDTDHQGYVTLFASSLPELDVFDRDMQNKAKNWHMKLNPMKGQQRAALTTILPLGI